MDIKIKDKKGVFFTMVIIMYNPITDEELEYIAYNNIVDIINGTYSS